jgi:hypothetical protein
MMIPIWSFNETTGSWTYEQTGTLVEKSPVDADNFTIPFTTSHLSNWIVSDVTETCTVKVNVPVNFAPLVKVLLANETAGFALSDVLSSTATSTTFLQVPKVNGFVGVSSSGVLIGKKAAAFCAGDVTFTAADLTAPPVAKFGQVVVNVTEACSDDSGSQPLPAAVNINDSLFGYADKATEAATVATVTFATVPVAASGTSSVTLKVTGSRKPFTVVTQTATVTDGQTTTVPVKFTATCATGG